MTDTAQEQTIERLKEINRAQAVRVLDLEMINEAQTVHIRELERLLNEFEAVCEMNKQLLGRIKKEIKEVEAVG